MHGAPVLIIGGEGYVGSALHAYLEGAGIAVQSVDCRPPKDASALPCLNISFQDLNSDDLDQFGTIILLAGHSTVVACDQCPVEGFSNNVMAFVDLVHKLRNQKLIFASSISVYVNTGGRLAQETDPLPEPISFYDFHKQTIERYASLAYPNSFALRLGTVTGSSPRLRTELLLNNLVRSAILSGSVQVANRRASRPLLGITDLCRAVESFVRRSVKPGCYNLASLNVKIGDLADHVARRFQVQCLEVERENNYDIQVDTRKFTESTGMVFRDTVESLIDDLEAFYRSPTEPLAASHGL
jgi:nucleoside-diphosphate-sugar epimerase